MPNFWADRPSPHDCPVCAGCQPSNVHGTLADCSHGHQLVSAWLSFLPCSALVSNLHFTALRKDLRIAGRLGVPVSLYRLLHSHQGGSKAARQVISQYQECVPDRVTAALASATPPPLTGTSYNQDRHSPALIF